MEKSVCKIDREITENHANLVKVYDTIIWSACFYVDLSVNYEPILMKFCTGISKSCPNIGKNFVKL